MGFSTALIQPTFKTSPISNINFGGEWIDRIQKTAYRSLQHAISLTFTKPAKLEQTNTLHKKPRVAVIGAGITGISTAAHLISNGFEVIIFERDSTLGGIWANVNQTSSLQLSSLCYRFHPSVIWSSPDLVTQPEILSELHRIWSMYHLKTRTRFNYTVNQITRSLDKDDSNKTQWKINDGQEGLFDGLILAIGTCSTPRQVQFPGKEDFKGLWVHSSDLDRIDFKNARVVSIGGGASGVESIETAINRGALTTSLVTRSDKWFIPRSFLFCSLLAVNAHGRRTWPIDQFWEFILTQKHYRSRLNWMIPDPNQNGLFNETPIVNDVYLELIRRDQTKYVQAKVMKIKSTGLEVLRNQDQVLEFIPADIIVEATGYERAKLDFPSIQKLFIGSHSPRSGTEDDLSKKYSPPNLFLGSIMVGDPTCLMTNAAYIHGIGTVGHFHIGMFARLMMMFIIDKSTVPTREEMESWVDRKIEEKGGPLKFFTYSELMIWFIVFMMSEISRWKWIFFIFFGFGRAIS